MKLEFASVSDRLFTPALRRKFAVAVPVAVLVALAACAGTTAAGPQLEVDAAWARPSLAPIGHMDDHDHMDHHGPDAMAAAQGGGHGGEHGEGHDEGHAGMEAHHQSSGTTSAAYFVLHNHGGEADRLVAARTEIAGAVELHRSAIEDGVMRMRQVEAIEVPARGEVRLAPGGYHLMLIGVNRELKDGDRFTIMLEFERTGERAVEVLVGALAQ
jgi:copper(I)-binding protein